MNDAQLSHDALANTSREELTSALFASMVMQQTNLALMLLGKTPHPETGQTLRDLDGAKMFIDQLEMLQLKTRGNLDPQEEKLLKQSLTALRMAFVEAVEVVRSKKRRKTISALQVTDDLVRISIPASLSKAEEQHWIDEMLKRFEKRRDDMRKSGGKVLKRPGPELHLPALATRDRADPVVLLLEDPLGAFDDARR